MFSVPESKGDRFKLGFLACVVVFGGISGGYQIGSYFKDQYDTRSGIFHPRPQLRLRKQVPTSKLPGPERKQPSVLSFTLDETNSQVMIGRDDPEHERWCDIADNFFTRRFVAGYSNKTSPTVRINVQPMATGLKGRLEAKGLKPNFAYQIKLMGDFKDREGFEIIGRKGRWRLPGYETNYTDADYEDVPEAEKHTVEAYILFDYFVTDAEGQAIREFDLDSSLHVLWRSDQDTIGIEEETVTEYTVDASNFEIYSDPVYTTQTIGIWAERERERYTDADQVITLPPRSYQATLVLTEESFHAFESDGGYWATVFQLPIEFTITGDPQ